ncbi:hypothetical protein [Corynebacterium guaraldiae]|uniref:hypothetical protein n=1 Tax=Corynebacterium guaraldiae TaxID=3051103 RepID=UPI001177E4B5|nr:hypothetical protein [Corynebacterium guaraldiae]TRX43732.1 hypothetical protein FNY89_01105 [Corynebacterium guaraldiae]
MKHIHELCEEANQMAVECLGDWADVSGHYPYPYMVVNKETGTFVGIEDETDIHYILREYAKAVSDNPLRFNWTERSFAEDFLNRPARAVLTEDIVSKAFAMAVDW